MQSRYKVSFVQPNFQQGPKEFNAYYLPYSVGVIWAYAQSDTRINAAFEIDQLVWRRDAIDEVASKLVHSDIVAFSTYVWNHQYNYTLAAEVKKRNPQALVLFGGPEPAVTDPQIFKTMPWCDAIIKHEGEITFKAILERYADKRGFDDLPGLVINRNGQAHDTGDAKRIESLDDIPSPYLIGLYDKIIEENPGIEWNATLETNRGCPFQCTFCDWGSLTYNKVKKFELERVYDELEWFGKHRCGFLSITDANFGMFPERDNLIADKIIEVQKKYGYPKTFSVAWAKNQKREVVDIVKKLLEAPGFNQGLTLSVQSLDVDVLENIRRRNMEVSKLEEVFELCEQRNIPTYTEMILGLPGETLDSWKENFWKLFRMGNHTGLTVFQAQLLQNAEMNLLQRRLFGIKSAVVKDYFSGSYSNEHIEEGIEVVTATKDLPTEKMLDAEIFSWFINNFHVNGITTLVSRVLYHLKGIDYSNFYTDFFEFLQQDPWYQKEQAEVRQYYANWMRDGSINHPPLGGIEIHGWNLIHRTVLNIHVEKKYDHVFNLVERFIGRYNLDAELQKNIMHFQREYLIAYDNINQYPKQITLDYNLWEFVTYKQPLEKKKSVLELEFPEDKSMSFARFLELYYFARRRNFGKAQVTVV